MKNIIKDAGTVDVNCMIGRGVDCSYKFSTAAELGAYLKKYHIAKALTASFMALRWNIAEGNESLVRETEGYDNILRVFIISPHLGTSEMPSRKELKEKLERYKVAAVKLYPASSGYPLDSFYAGSLLGLLDEMRMPVLIDWDENNFSSFPKLCSEFKNIPFIILEGGFKKSRIMYPLLEKTENVFFDICRFADSNLIEEIVIKFGAERLLFGSGMPRLSPGAAMALVTYADISNAEKKMILSGNWERIHGGVR
jgi:predicted TIM-barrel fold metal-dependent hydrolase